MPLDFVNTSSEYVLVPDNTLLDVGSADFCVMCWFNISTDGDEIISKGRFSSAFPGWQLRKNSAGGGGQILGVFGDGSGGFDIVQTAGAIPLNVWAHVAMVRDNGASLYRLYIDGVEIDTTAISAASGSLNNSNDFLIGAVEEPAGTPTRFMDGLIEDVRQYSRALSPEEILTIYSGGQTAGHDGIVQSLVARYLMNELEIGAAASIAGSIIDSGPNGLNGTPTNTPTYAASQLSFRKLVL